MGEYVYKQELLDLLEKKIKAENERRMAVVDSDFIDLVNDATEINDVVKVVRCKNCKYHHWEQDPEHGKTVHLCVILNAEVFRDFYCYYGEHKQQEGDKVMSRYINAEVLKKALSHFGIEDAIYRDEIEMYIDDTPTVDVVEVINNALLDGGKCEMIKGIEFTKSILCDKDVAVQVAEFCNTHGITKDRIIDIKYTKANDGSWRASAMLLYEDKS